MLSKTESSSLPVTSEKEGGGALGVLRRVFILIGFAAATGIRGKSDVYEVYLGAFSFSLNETGSKASRADLTMA